MRGHDQVLSMLELSSVEEIDIFNFFFFGGVIFPALESKFEFLTPPF